MTDGTRVLLMVYGVLGALLSLLACTTLANCTSGATTIRACASACGPDGVAYVDAAECVCAEAS